MSVLVFVLYENMRTHSVVREHTLYTRNAEALLCQSWYSIWFYLVFISMRLREHTLYARHLQGDTDLGEGAAAVDSPQVGGQSLGENAQMHSVQNIFYRKRTHSIFNEHIL